jgi:pimeloyl-ACP methyl ester carboxylesterase
MRRSRPKPLRAAAVLVASAALGASLLTVGCSYLKWRHEKKVARAQLRRHPTLLLEKDLAPEDCFVLTGRGVAPPDGHLDPFLVAAYDHANPRVLIGSHEVVYPDGTYGILLPNGEYDLLFFTDVDRDGFYETEEVAGHSGGPVTVGPTASRDGVTVLTPDVMVDRAHPTPGDRALRVPTARKEFVVQSVDDPIFDPEYGEMGVYHPNRFVARTQNWLFSIGEPHLARPQVILVHGINGTPRDFSKLIEGIDRKRYQVWLFYYPTGLSLDKLGIILARVVELLADEAQSPEFRVAIVAHSMGGLVGRRAVNELCRNGKPAYLRAYASFDTPYGGIDQVVGAVKSGRELVASWKDLAADSKFLARLHEAPLPRDLPFHLFFGWGNHSDHGPSVAGDGTISLASQLDPRVQAAATEISGYPATHVGVLSDPAALRALDRLLDATLGGGSPGAVASAR